MKQYMARKYFTVTNLCPQAGGFSWKRIATAAIADIDSYR